MNAKHHSGKTTAETHFDGQQPPYVHRRGDLRKVRTQEVPKRRVGGRRQLTEQIRGRGAHPDEQDRGGGG